MSKKALQSVIKARNLAEEKSQIRVAVMNRKLNACQQQLQEANKNLIDYRRDREARQMAMYKEMERHPIGMVELQSYRINVFIGSQDEAELIAQISNQQKLGQQAEIDLENAKKILNTARRACEKLKQQMQVYDAQEKQQQELEEDDALDEFSITNRIVKRSTNLLRPI